MVPDAAEDSDARHSAAGGEAAIGQPTVGMALAAPPHRDVATHMIATIVGNLFPPMALLITAPLLAYGLGVTGRGEVAGATAPLILVTTAATFGIPQALTHVVARSPEVLRRAVRHSFEIIILTGIIAMVAVFLCAHWLGGDDPKLPELIVVAALAILPGLLLTVLRGLASGLHLWSLVALEQFWSSALELAAILALVFTGTLTPLTATIVIAFSPVTGAIAYRKLVRGQSAQSSSARANPLGSRRFLSNFGVRVWIGALSGILLSRLDQTLMTPLADAYQLGLYAIAVTVSQIPLVINNAVRDVTFSADSADSREGADERLAASARISSAASALVGIVVGLTMIWWIPILFGREFHDAIAVSAVLIVAVVIGTPGSIAGAGLGARGRPGLRSASLVFASILNAALVFLLVPSHGALGAAFATLIGNVFSANGCIFFLWRLSGIRPIDVYGLRRKDVARIRRFVARKISAHTGQHRAAMPR